MENKNFWEGENLPEKEETSLSAPETFYHNINTPPTENEDRYYEVFDEDKPKSMIWSLISFILGIASVLCAFLGWGGLIIGAVSIVFAIVSRINLKYFDKFSIAGLILGIFGMVFGLALLIFGILAESGKLFK